jgi:hypothetical protein
LTTTPTAAAQPSRTYAVSVEVESDGGQKRRRRSQQPRKRGGRRLDRRRKTASKGISTKERRNVVGAENFAYRIGRRLQTTLDFHPVYLDAQPEGDLDSFFAGLRNRIATWCRRRIGGSWWVWTRENYEGDGREHLHMVMHLPPRLRSELEAAIRLWYSGAPDVVQVGERKAFYNHATGRRTDGLSYRLKQMRGDAVGPPGPTRLYRETKSRHDGAPVAPVHGKRCGVSDSLTHKAEEVWLATGQNT